MPSPAPKRIATATLTLPQLKEGAKPYAQEDQETLDWFREHLATGALANWKQVKAAVGFDSATVHKVYAGNYPASVANFIAGLRAYRNLLADRSTVRKFQFVENAVARLTWTGLDYARTHGVITEVVGEPGVGKSIAARQWAREIGAPAACYFIVPSIGGRRTLLDSIAQATGKASGDTAEALFAGLMRVLGPHSTLVADEAHRLLPSERRSEPHLLDLLRDLHDRTGCAIGLVSTHRFRNSIERFKGSYLLDQWTSRVALQVEIPPRIERADIEPIVRQFDPNADERFLNRMHEVALAEGHVRTLSHLLSVAMIIAENSNQTPGEAHVDRALTTRIQLAGKKAA